MPISLLPSDRRLFWLKCDADTPLPERPVFECRSLTRAARIEYLRIWDEFAKMLGDESVSDDVFHAKCLDLIMFGVSGWRNMGQPFARENIEKVLNDDEILELATSWPKAFAMTEEERVGFPLPQRSGAVNSAANAKDSVSTHPQNNSPSDVETSPSPNAPSDTSVANSAK